MATLSAWCVACALRLAVGGTLVRSEPIGSGVQFIEVSPHQLTNFRSTPSVAAEALLQSTDSAGKRSSSSKRMIRREIFDEQRSEEDKAHITWGGYGIDYIPYMFQCKNTPESDCHADWTNCSYAGLWSGAEGRLTVSSSHIMMNNQMVEGTQALLIYKAACPASISRIIGVTMDIPLTTEVVDMVFGITRHCTGLCAPFTVAVLDSASMEVKHRWCFNHEGNETEVTCSTDLVVPNYEWNRVQLNITPFTDYTTPLKLELSAYTNGDFPWMPSLSDQVGIGGVALTIVDALIMRPVANPSPSASYDSTPIACSVAQSQVCNVNSWCFEKYRCHSGWCVQGAGRCNMRRNCQDDSDEVGCEYRQGLLAKFFFTHGRFIHGDEDLTEQPDFARLHEEVDYDTDDFYQSFGVKDYFAVHWQGNLTIDLAGNYYFNFLNSSGTIVMQLWGVDDLEGQAHNITSGNHASLSSGKYELLIKFVHTTGAPAVELKYAGPDTNDAYEYLPKSKTSATMTGSRCDTLSCGDGLIVKPNQSDILCGGAPCDAVIDTSTCCSPRYQKVVAGKYHTCALDWYHKPVCWGSWPGRLQEWKNHPGPFVDLDTFDNFTCGVLKNLLTLDCWTKEGLETNTIAFSLGSQFLNISIGGDHICARRENSNIACSGANDHLQTEEPEETFSMVTSGEDFTCGIKSADGAAHCWGWNQYGQVNDVTTEVGMKHISAGTKHACGIKSDKSIACWGLNADNQATPPSGTDFRTVEAGGEHTCALKMDGNVECWGSNAKGQCSPRTEDLPMSQITSGHLHSCGIRAHDNIVVCWGSNFEPDENGNDIWRGQAMPPPASSTWPPGGPYDDGTSTSAAPD